MLQKIYSVIDYLYEEIKQIRTTDCQPQQG